jgi:hypothetical protein
MNQTLLIAAPPLLTEGRVSVRCPSCGRFAEAPTYGRNCVVGPLPAGLLKAHAGCDLWSLQHQLSIAARELAEDLR